MSQPAKTIITPMIESEQILNTLTSAVVVVDSDNDIVHVNIATCIKCT